MRVPDTLPDRRRGSAPAREHPIARGVFVYPDAPSWRGAPSAVAAMNEDLELPFRLLPYEDVIPGVRFRDGRLRLRTTLASAAVGAYALVVTAVFVVVGGWTRDVWFAAVAAVMLLMSVRFMFLRVVASGDEIVIVNKWRRVRVRVGDIRSVEVDRFAPPLGWFPLTGPTTLWPRNLAAGFLVTRSGLVRCDALVGMPRPEGDAIPTPIEQKAAILQRWITAARRGTGAVDEDTAGTK